MRVSIGLSFHDESSLVEVVGSLQFNTADNPNQVLGMGSISQDGSFRIGLDDPNAGPEIVGIGQDDDIGSGDDIQMVYR